MHGFVKCFRGLFGGNGPVDLQVVLVRWGLNHLPRAMKSDQNELT